jgi:hemerythrin
VTEFIAWNDDKLPGVEALDHQHKTLVDCINNLAAECMRTETVPVENRKQRGELLAQLSDDLYSTTNKHFSLEEMLMRKEGYPAYVAHTRQHVMLLAELQATYITGLKDGRCNFKPISCRH